MTLPTAPPLHGVKVVEMAANGPVPFGGMILADFGCDVVRVERSEARGGPIAPGVEIHHDVCGRGKRSIGVNLKDARGVSIVRQLVSEADVFLEGWRPGVAERLGIGPEVLRADNPRLIYARVTGYGQEGPYADAPGHDINYISMAGALGLIGRQGNAPTPPLNLLADYAGGGMMLGLGVLAAVIERQRSGVGQTLDVSMTDGVLLMMASLLGRSEMGPRGTNWLDSGAPFYEVYRTSDGGYMAVGAVEEQFWGELLKRTELDDDTLPNRWDPEQWTQLKQVLSEKFATRTRQEWCDVFKDGAACVTPVLSVRELPEHTHHLARHSFVDCEDGLIQPAPTPRFDRTSLDNPARPPTPGADTVGILDELGHGRTEIRRLLDEGVVYGKLD